MADGIRGWVDGLALEVEGGDRRFRVVFADSASMNADTGRLAAFARTVRRWTRREFVPAGRGAQALIPYGDAFATIRQAKGPLLWIGFFRADADGACELTEFQVTAFQAARFAEEIAPSK